MTKKRAAVGSPRPVRPPVPRPVPVEPKLPPLPLIDAIAARIARLPRLVRMLIAALVAAVITGAVGITFFTLMFSIPPDRLPDNILTLSLLGLAILGLVMYWVGWRVLVGFDFDDEPHVPGQAAVLWIGFGVLVLVAAVVLSVLATLEATGPI